jgi:hypothetical protein
MTRQRNYWLQVFVIALGLLAIGCGSQSSANNSGGTTQQTVPTAITAEADNGADSDSDTEDTGGDGSFKDAYGNLTLAQSYHFRVDEEWEDPEKGGIAKTTAEGDHDRTNSALRFTLKREPDGNGVPIPAQSGEWIHAASKSYRQEGGNWKQADDPIILDSLSSIQSILGPSDATDAVLVGSEKIEGQDTSHYRFDGSFDDCCEGSKWEAWVSKSTGEFVRVTVDVKRLDGKAWRYSTVLSKIDEPVTIQAPK